MLNLLTIFDLDPRAATLKPLQLIWWHCNIDSISRTKDCVLKNIGDINNSSNYIPWFCKCHSRTNRIVTNDGVKWFSEVLAKYLGAAIGTVTSLKFLHFFHRVYLWWYDRSQDLLIIVYILNWERHSENIFHIIIIVLTKEATYPVMTMWTADALSSVRVCW